jgi:hypothetical protein
MRESTCFVFTLLPAFTVFFATFVNIALIFRVINQNDPLKLSSGGPKRRGKEVSAKELQIKIICNSEIISELGEK